MQKAEIKVARMLHIPLGADLTELEITNFSGKLDIIKYEGTQESYYKDGYATAFTKFLAEDGTVICTAPETLEEPQPNAVEEPETKVQKLQAFKDYVHRRLDEAGIEKEPQGKHSKHGCRIGDRLDIVLSNHNGTPELHPSAEPLKIEPEETTGIIGRKVQINWPTAKNTLFRVLDRYNEAKATTPPANYVNYDMYLCEVVCEAEDEEHLYQLGQVLNVHCRDILWTDSREKVFSREVVMDELEGQDEEG